MQSWRRLKQRIPGAGENVARSQATLSQPLLAGFRKDCRATRLDSSYRRGCKGSQSSDLWLLYSSTYLSRFFFPIKKKAVSWDDCSHPKLLGWPLPIFLSTLSSSYAFHVPLFTLFSRFLPNSTVPHPTNRGTYNLRICLVCSAQA